MDTIKTKCYSMVCKIYYYFIFEDICLAILLYTLVYNYIDFIVAFFCLLQAFALFEIGVFFFILLKGLNLTQTFCFKRRTIKIKDIERWKINKIRQNGFSCFHFIAICDVLFLKN